MASSPQLSGQSIVPRMRSESGQISCTGEFAVFFVFFFYFFKIVFGRFVSCPILNKDQKQSVVSFYSCSSFKFNTQEKVSFHLLARLPFSYSLKFRTRIGTLLNLNIFKVFVVKLLQGQNTSCKESLFPTELVTYNLKIYSPFMASSPQLSGQSIVPRKRSQSGWRSCSGELAVFCFFFLTYFQEGSFLFRVCMKIKNNVKCLRILPSFHFITLAKVFFHLLTSLSFSYFPKLRTVIGMLLNRNVIKQHFFCREIVLQSNHSAFHGMFVHLIHALCAPLVPYSSKIYSPFIASSPQLSGQSIVPQKRSQSGWRSCSGELAVFIGFCSLYFFLFVRFFSYRVCTQIKN